jgi:hypothetical protein
VPDVEPLSDELERWLAVGDRTMGDLVDDFGTRSFALLFVVLLAVPALPIPTGGVTHVLEVIAVLLAGELLLGRGAVWLPDRWRRKRLQFLGGRTGRLLIGRIRTVERFSRPRGGWLLEHPLVRRLYGAVVVVLAVTAFLAPPFSGLDTLPALGVVLISLGMLAGDVAIAAVGALAGAAGIALVVGLGHAITRLL